jgi:hypothetical protein
MSSREAGCIGQVPTDLTGVVSYKEVDNQVQVNTYNLILGGTAPAKQTINLTNLIFQ